MGAVSTEISVADVLRHRILTGRLGVGDRLRQSDIAAELGVSTTPVREALRMLVAEGLVEIDTNRGAVIRPLSDAELAETLELQMAVEVLMLGPAVRAMNEAALAEARALHERMTVTDDAVEWALLNRDFHLALSAPSGRVRNLRLFRDLCNVTTIQLREDIDNWAGRKAEGEADHAALLDAASRRDAAAALAVLREHIQVSIDRRRTPDRPAS